MKFAGILFITALIVSAAHSQSTPKVVSGPMPGYTTMNEVGVWLQLDGEANVQLEYWKVDDNDSKQLTPFVHTSQKSAFTASFVLADLEPGQTYRYRVKHNDQEILNGEELVVRTQSLWQYRTDPPSFKLALGSCAYINEEGFDRPGKAYGSGYEIFNRISDQAPDLMLWLGDNIYLREPDWGSRSGYLHRYSHSRAIPELQRLLRTTHHYAIWDDHDFGPNDANGSWPYKMWALESFNLFWMNPPVTPGLQGITTSFRYNDIDMFL
jgi:alkaline phosphatase D